MAFSLKKPSNKTSPSNDDDILPAYDRHSTNTLDAQRDAPRKKRLPPPSPGSGYSDFLDWASDGALEPSEQEKLLAITVWSGQTGFDVETDNQSLGCKM